METLEKGDKVYDEENDAVMEVISTDGVMATCTWRATTGGELRTGTFHQSSLKKISIEGGHSSSTQGVSDKDLE